MRLRSRPVTSLMLAGLFLAPLPCPALLLAQSANSDSLRSGNSAVADAASPGDTAASDAGNGVRWFPDRWVMAQLIAAPREIRLAGSLLSVDRDLEYEPDGNAFESEVSLGYRIPVVLLMDGGQEGLALDIGFEVGVWSRFNMETRQRDLIASDYRVGVPVSARYRSLEGRLTFQHTSGHLGDDYVYRYDLPVYQVSRQALELTLAVRPVPPVRIYGGGDWNVDRGLNYSGEEESLGQEFEGVEQWVLRFGAEYDPSWQKEGSPQPFLGVNFQTTDWTDRLATSVRGGVAFRVSSVRILLDAQYNDGPSAMSQFGLDPAGFDNLDDPNPFRGVDERMFGVGLTVQIGSLVPPGPADRGS